MRPRVVPFIFGAMKTLLLFIVIAFPNLCFCQPRELRQIDSLAYKVLLERSDYFKADSLFLYDKDSNAIGGSHRQLYYTDSPGKNLVYVDELSFTPDTTGIQFFFQANRLVKVEARYYDGGRSDV